MGPDKRSASSAANEDVLRDKEVALVKLGTLYRDSRYLSTRTMVRRVFLTFIFDDNLGSMLDKLAQLITDSRTFMSHIAKAKTTRLGELASLVFQVLALITLCPKCALSWTFFLKVQRICK